MRLDSLAALAAGLLGGLALDVSALRLDLGPDPISLVAVPERRRYTCPRWLRSMPTARQAVTRPRRAHALGCHQQRRRHKRKRFVQALRRTA